MNDKLTFNEIFKGSYLKEFLAVNISLGEMIAAMSVAVAFGFALFFVYRKFYRGVLYTHSYARALVLVTVITSIVILAIQTNVILSLGMVGALSIVRFRTAVKDAVDIAFMFWAIALGICAAANLVYVGMASFIILVPILWILNNSSAGDAPYLLFMSVASDDKDSKVASEESGFSDKIIASVRGSIVLKSCTAVGSNREYVFEMRVQDPDSVVQTVLAFPAVTSASVVAYNADYSS